MKLTNRGYAAVVTGIIAVAAVTAGIATNVESNQTPTNSANVGAVQNSIPLSQKGAANGVATLDGSRHLTQKQLLTGGTEGECLQRKGTEELKWGTCASGGSGKSQGEIEEFALARSKNLSDLASASTARTNLGAASTTEVNLKAPIASPTFTGTPASETALAKDNTSQIATDKFVQTAKTEAESNSLAKANNSVLTANINAGAVTEPKLTQGTEGKLVPTGGEAGQCLARKGTTELTFSACSGGKSQAEIEVFAATKTEINLKAPIESPNFTGTPELSASPIESTNNKRIATTKFVHEVATSEKAAAESNSLAKASNSVKEINIEAGAVTEGKIGSEAVAEAKIKALAVTAGKLGPEAVEEGKIKALAVTAGKLGSEAVETAKIKSAAVTAAKIEPGTSEDPLVGHATHAEFEQLKAAGIASNAVTEAKINSEAVTAAKIGSGAVTSAKLGSESVLQVALAEALVPAETAATVSASTTALNLKKRLFGQSFFLTVEHATTLELTEPPAGLPTKVAIHFKENGTGGFEVKVPAATKWEGTAAPLSTWTKASTEYVVECEVAGGKGTEPWCWAGTESLPSGGSEGEFVVKGASAPEWQAPKVGETKAWAEAGKVEESTAKLPGFFTYLAANEKQKFVKLTCKLSKGKIAKVKVLVGGSAKLELALATEGKTEEATGTFEPAASKEAVELELETPSATPENLMCTMAVERTIK